MKYKQLILEYLSKYPHPEHSFTFIAKKILEENEIECNSSDWMRKNIASVFKDNGDSQSFSPDLKSSDKKKFDCNGDNASYEYQGRESITSLDQAIRFFKIDTDKWEVDRFVTNSWDVTNSEGTTYTNYQVKVFLVKKKIQTDPNLFLNFVKEELFKQAPKFPTINFKFSEGDKMLEVGIHDFHFGKHAWSKEVGEDYDLKIAEELYGNTVDTIIQRSSHYNYDKILYIVGSDFFNVDNIDNTTTKGTPQDEDTRWQKTFQKGIDISRTQALKLSQIAPVEVIIISGNHDQTRAFFLGSVLEAYFYNNQNITVNNSPMRRKYVKYGVCGIGFAHGDKVPEKSWNQIFAAEQPELWGSTKYREMHTGDKHHVVKKSNTVKINENDTVKEYKGCTFRITRSITSLDDYHYSHGYVGTIRGTEAFVWDKKAGLINIINANL